jgi:5-methylcytosine-specific restriction protein A
MPTSPELPAASTTSWSDEELMSAVQAYLGMLRFELKGEPYNKAEVNRQLREGPLAGRTKASVEFRMQNISAALYELKMPYITGYLPARNIGSAVKEKMVELLRQNDIDFLAAYVPTADANALSAKVSALRKQAYLKMPSGSTHPQLTVKPTSSYVRDPAVKAWVLQIADGICEGCGHHAHFIGNDGLPYLEVHHVMPLASHGSDTPTNAVALCPNCHRRCHYSHDSDEFKLRLYENIPRLKLEVPEPIDAGTYESIDVDQSQALK